MALPLPETKLLNKAHTRLFMPEYVPYILHHTKQLFTLLWTIHNILYLCSFLPQILLCLLMKNRSKETMSGLSSVESQEPCTVSNTEWTQKGKLIYPRTHRYWQERAGVWICWSSAVHFLFQNMWWFEETGFLSGIGEILWLLFVQSWDFIWYISNVSWHFPWATGKK